MSDKRYGRVEEMRSTRWHGATPRSGQSDTRTHTHTSTPTDTHTHVHTDIHTHADTHAHTDTHRHTPTHPHTRTPTPTHKRTFGCSGEVCVDGGLWVWGQRNDVHAPTAVTHTRDLQYSPAPRPTTATPTPQSIPATPTTKHSPLPSSNLLHHPPPLCPPACLPAMHIT